MLQIIQKPLWWFIVILFVPCINLVFLVLVYIEIGKKFGKSPGWSIVFLFLLPIFGFPILAFGDAQYQK